ncbi:hypothetical protein O0L34_g5070 [Tuta absoluta]|nr:hypothetical protein O0L34_g5070 [Tuta absoluta]
MDDLVDSYATPEEAQAVVDEVRKVHKSANFTMASWTSNYEEVLQDVPDELRADTNRRDLGAGAHEFEKTLGLRWHSATDELSFNTNLPRVKEEVKKRERPPTKREALSMIMSIFDPLGLLSFFTIRAKIQLQRVWRLKVDWDEPLPDEIAKDFGDWTEALDDIASLRLQRCYNTGGAIKDRQLHVFCDASTEAFAAAAYWRLEEEDGSVRVILVSAKARVAPLRAQSIPRMELQAALLGARLATAITTEHREKPSNTTYWSDSKTALQWIRNDNAKHTPFVAHRVTEIAELTNPRNWRWIPTDQNVADDATRPSREMKDAADRWFTGPGFLRLNEEHWPKEAQTDEHDQPEEAYVQHVRASISDALPDITRFSKFERLIRATAYVLLFIDACRKRTRKLKVRHLQEAEKLWVKKSQEDAYPDELDQLKRKGTISKTSKLFKLDPTVDEEGILRLQGRINAAPNVGEDTKRPIILDGRHPYTRLLVAREHEHANHANNERVVNDLRQRYWITSLRPTVRAAARKCGHCRLRKAAPVVPPHGDLPMARLQPFTRAFTYTGVDYFGPLTVTVGRRHEKRWGAIFTCLSTRAIHIELAHSLSTNSAILALRRMASRRGWPHTIWSDNATNFKGADVELRAAYKQWLPALKDYAAIKRTEWKFIAPGAPNQGGAWERLIRSIKTALTTTLHEKYPRDEVLATLLCEAEHTINGRPLTHVPVSKDDPEALTPNHFLIGSSSGLPITGNCEHAGRHTWRATMALADEFWRRWIAEYLPTLTPRGASHDDSRNVKQGDLVIVVDANLPRNVWPRGEVVRTYPGPDGKVRCVDVRTKGGVFQRPVRKLAVLPVQDGSGDFAGGRMLRTASTVRPK